MSGHIYSINFLHWNAKGSKNGKISGFFALFAHFASTLPFTANPNFENVS
jgi:hypothetical protein